MQEYEAALKGVGCDLEPLAYVKKYKRGSNVFKEKWAN